MNNFERYYDAINFLEGLSNLPLNGDYMAKQRHLGVYLKRMRYFLGLIGNPDRGMKYIHITGTAGKGTVTNMVHEILKVSGKNVGSFTSPFVTTSIEKIKVKDTYIAPNELADIVEYLKHVDGSTSKFIDFQRNAEYSNYARDFENRGKIPKEELDTVIKEYPKMNYTQAHSYLLSMDPKKAVQFAKSLIANSQKATKKQLMLKKKGNLMPGAGKSTGGNKSVTSYFDTDGNPNRDFKKLSDEKKAEISEQYVKHLEKGM